MDSMMVPFVETELKKVSNEDLDLLEASIEYMFHFSFVWSLLVTVDWEGRVKLDKFHRAMMAKHKAGIVFPDEGMVYDQSYSMVNKAW
jgi:dynein heavy chain, axonemal